jgi:hypothetical protein
MKIVQIKGSNGSGKTTIAKELIASSKDRWLLLADDKPFATQLDDLKWIIIGQYKPESKMGGCDGMDGIAEIKRAIWLCYKHFPDYNVLFEGMMISTIKSTFYEYLTELPEVDPLFVILRTDAAKCVERIAGRGTMKADLKVDNIITKCKMVVSHALTYNQDYVRWLDVDTIPKDEMLKWFLWAVGCDISRQV